MMLVKALERGLRQEEPEHEWDNQNLHVSDLSVALEPEDRKCPRSLWLRLQGADKKELTTGQLLMFKQGNNLHELAAELLESGLEDWKVNAVELNINNLLPDGLTGRLDTLLRQGDNLRVVDFKSQRGKAFQYLTEPKPSHTLQVQTYMMAVGAELGYILYIDREGSWFAKQFEIERDDIKVEKAIKKAKEIINKKEPPKIMKPKLLLKQNKNYQSIYLTPVWQCGYCEYRDVSCPGDIPLKYREILPKNKQGHIKKKVLGHLKEDIEMKKDYKQLQPFISRLMEEELKEVV